MSMTNEIKNKIAANNLRIKEIKGKMKIKKDVLRIVCTQIDHFEDEIKDLIVEIKMLKGGKCYE